jgi:hypothetical protein
VNGLLHTYTASMPSTLELDRIEAMRYYTFVVDRTNSAVNHASGVREIGRKQVSPAVHHMS